MNVFGEVEGLIGAAKRALKVARGGPDGLELQQLSTRVAAPGDFVELVLGQPDGLEALRRKAHGFQRSRIALGPGRPPCGQEPARQCQLGGRKDRAAGNAAQVEEGAAREVQPTFAVKRPVVLGIPHRAHKALRPARLDHSGLALISTAVLLEELGPRKPRLTLQSVDRRGAPPVWASPSPARPGLTLESAEIRRQ